jgi:hypothetical protein
MAQIVQLPSAPNTSLSRLGDVLIGSAADYAHNKRQTDREARLRTERLADIQDERAFQTGQRQEIRTERLADDRARDEMAVKSELVRLGYLKPSQLDNAEAFAAALDIVRQNGLAQRYAEAMKTGDLTYADLGDAAKVDAGLAKFAQRLGAQSTFQETQRTRAGDSQNALAQAEADLIQQANALDAELSQPPPQPSRQEVEQMAVQMVRASGQPVNDQTLAAALPEAADKLREDLLVRWSQAKQQKLIQRQLLEARLRDNAARQNTNTNRFGVVGLADPSVQTPQAASAPRASLESARQAFTAAITPPASRPAPAAPAPTLYNPDANPIIAEEQQLRQAGQERARLAPIQSLQNELVTVDREIARIQQAPRPNQISIGPGLGGYSVQSTPSTSLLADQLSNLFTKRDAIRNRLRSLQDPVQPVNTAVSTQPARSSSDAPQWWGTTPAFIE